MLARVTLRLVSLPKVRRLIHRWFQITMPFMHGKQVSVRQVVWAAVSAGHHSPLGTTCLTTALVAQALLGKYGHEAKLRIGVRRKETGEFTAHAWLEHEGKVIVGGPSEMIAGYSAMPEMEHLIA